MADDDDYPSPLKESQRGWAPCTHTPEQQAARNEYLIPGATVEQLIVEINMLGGAPTIAVDQWWGIRTRGELVTEADDVPDLELHTYIQADHLLDGLTETYRRWKLRWEKLHGREYLWGPDAPSAPDATRDTKQPETTA